MPEDKLAAVEELSAGGTGAVGMVGDGINDAPALARADIGFAMGAMGTDTAIETADVALMDDDLRKIPAFVRLSQFSSDLAHDMRTPLANVISSSQVTLSRARTTEEYEALIDSNIEECERLQRMIENMLFLARTDNARQHLKTTELDAGSELRRLASYFQALADEAGVRIDVHGEAPVVADATLFRRAVSNLASNALEHAEAASTIELAVSMHGSYAVVEVTNRGAAIPPEQVDRIFERFYRIDSSRHGAARNAGLGLAIVKSIMELHRGKVEVASRDGRTTFALYFPRGTARQIAC